MKRTGNQLRYQKWDATKLQTGTNVFQHKTFPEDMLIVIVDNQYIAYHTLQWIK